MYIFFGLYMYKYTSYIHVFVFEAQLDLGGLNAVHSQ